MTIRTGRPAIYEAIDQARRDRDTYGVPQAAFKAFCSHYHNALRRQIPFEFSLLGWHLWWSTNLRAVAGVRGRRGSDYVMARRGDRGPYAPDNVYLSTQSDNIRAWDRATKAPPKPGSRSGEHLRVRETHPAARAVISPEGAFDSAALAAESNGVPVWKAQRWARGQLQGWRYVDDPRRPLAPP